MGGYRGRVLLTVWYSSSTKFPSDFSSFSLKYGCNSLMIPSVLRMRTKGGGGGCSSTGSVEGSDGDNVSGAVDEYTYTYTYRRRKSALPLNFLRG
jgi:hypothetical protein